jgi:hypothetical protein
MLEKMCFVNPWLAKLYIICEIYKVILSCGGRGVVFKKLRTIYLVCQSVPPRVSKMHQKMVIPSEFE